jgi:TolB protein
MAKKTAFFLYSTVLQILFVCASAAHVHLSTLRDGSLQKRIFAGRTVNKKGSFASLFGEANFMRVALLAIALTMASFTAEARVRIYLDEGNTAPLPIALIPFDGPDSEMDEMGEKMRKVIMNNLNNSGLFEVIKKKAYLQDNASLVREGPKFAEWKLIKAEGLVMGSIVEENDKVTVEFRLMDVYGEKQLSGRRYSADKQFWRHLAHRVSDDIYSTMTGEKGYFATRVVHISEQKRANEIVKKLCVMDQDGENYQCLTDGSHLVLTPRFSPEAQQLIYMSYENGRPRLYFLDLPTGKQTIVGDYEGLNSSPRFSPDGKSIVMTLTKGHEGNAEIYSMNLRSKKLKRLTNQRGIDTSPDFSPDGKQIVFNSDRGGKAALYIMKKNGKGVRRLTFGDGRYYAPVWSPRGDLIAFVKEYKGRFGIGVIDVDGKEERMLTDSFLDESPTWSPNGRVIAFARQKGDVTKMYTIDLTGHNERQMPTPLNASDPAWSPLLH